MIRSSVHLTLDQAVARIVRWRGASSLNASPLPGGITNVSYRVDVDGEVFVLRIEGTGTEHLGVDRRREYRCLLAAARTGVGPEVVEWLPDHGLLVTRFIGGRPLSAADLERPEMLERVVRSLRLYHGGPDFQGLFSPFLAVQDYLRAARGQGAPLPGDTQRMYEHAAEIDRALRPGWPTARPCHNDLWGPNLIDDGTLVRIVDWEYAAMGDVHFDLANLAIHHRFSDTEDEALLNAYSGGVSARSLARLKLLKILAELREAMWCMVGVTFSEADFDFFGYAATHFDRYREALDDTRLSDWMVEANAG
ncbi:MAG TPA: choline/ethanolamine kinase family protein [bacterium]